MTILLETFNYENHIYRSVNPKNSITQAGSSSSGKGTSLKFILSQKYSSFVTETTLILSSTQFVNCDHNNLLSSQISILSKISIFIQKIQRQVLHLKITVQDIRKIPLGAMR